MRDCEDFQSLVIWKTDDDDIYDEVILQVKNTSLFLPQLIWLLHPFIHPGCHCHSGVLVPYCSPEELKTLSSMLRDHHHPQEH